MKLLVLVCVLLEVCGEIVGTVGCVLLEVCFLKLLLL